MTTQTWGVYIPGYSYPSVSQQKRYNKMYPGQSAFIKEVREEYAKREDEIRKRIIAEERAKHAVCKHLFVPTNIKEECVCKLCNLWVDKLQA